MVNSYLLPLAVPLMLLSADLRRVLCDTGRLLLAFCCGAAATIAGSLLAFWLLPLRALGADGWKVAASLTARHIGGSVNFVAVSEVLQLSPAVRMAGLAADDVIVSLYFLALYALARNEPPEPLAVSRGSSGADSVSSAGSASSSGSVHGGSGGAAAAAAPAAHHANQGRGDQRAVTVLNGSMALAVSTAICFTGAGGQAWPQHANTTPVTHVRGMSFALVFPVVPGVETAKRIGYAGGGITVITFLTVALATLAPSLVAPLAPAGEGLAVILMQVCLCGVCECVSW